MRILIVIFLLISNFALCQNANNTVLSDTIWIKPGVGIDNLQFKKSLQSEVQNYRGMYFKKSDGEGIACGTGPSIYNFTTDFYSKANGIRFNFSTPWGTEPDKIKNQSKKLVSINLKQTKNACLENGLCIGTSSYKDVVKKMRKPRRWRNKYFIAFYDKGISFHFDTNRIIYSIDVYEPQE